MTPPNRRPGFDATRRSRNIGTEKQGHGQDNRMVIPSRWSDDRVYYEVLRNPVPVVRRAAGNRVTFLVEPTIKGFVHACTLDDVCHVLAHLPADHWREIDLIILRQPTRKQNRLNPVWGRLIYYANVGRYEGPAIFLDAQDPDEPIRWTRSLDREGEQELARLEGDGHEVHRDRRHYLISRSLRSIRTTQLYRTLIHEVGHEVDWQRSVVWPFLDREGAEVEEERAQETYGARPSVEKEAFAHRYADETRRELETTGIIPFERQVSEAGLREDNLRPEWFGLE